MRKLLLGTTAVVGAALLSTGASAQTAPTVRIGGYMDFSFTFLSDSADRGVQTAIANRGPNGRTPRATDFRSDMEIHVLVSGKTAGGITYGARIEFQNDNFGGSGSGTGVDTDETWLFVSSPTLGTVRFGDTDAAAAVMQVRPPSIPVRARGTWWVARPGGFNYVQSGVTDGSDTTKIVYLSPQFAGFDFGVSYAINAGEGPRAQFGTSALIDRDRQGRQNEITAALRYRGNFSGVGVAASFVAMTAESGVNQREPATAVNAGARNTMNAFSLGGTLAFQGFTFGGEYTFGNYRGASVGLAPTARGASMSWHYLLGASYNFNPVTVTANFGQGFQDGRRPTAGASVRDMRHMIIGVGATYTLAPGLATYISYQFDRFRGWPGNPTGSVAPGQNRTFQAVTIGTILTF